MYRVSLKGAEEMLPRIPETKMQQPNATYLSPKVDHFGSTE